MSRRHIQKHNRQRAPGSEMPDALGAMMTLVTWLEGDLTPALKANLILNWLHFDAFDKDRRWRRLSGAEAPQPFTVRLVGRKNQSTVEMALYQPIHSDSTALWVPLPPPLNRACIDVIRKVKNGAPLLSDKAFSAWQQLCQSRKGLTIPPFLTSVTAMHATSWRRYFVRCAESDNRLDPLTRRWLTQRDIERAGHHYQQIASDSLRHRIYDALCRYLDRLLDSMPKAMDTHLSPTSWTYQHLLQNEATAGYITEIDGRIPELRLHPEKESGYVEIAPTHFGSRRGLSTSQTAALLKQVRELCNASKPSPRAAKLRWYHYHNMVSHTLALHLVATSGLRPTHHISPYSPATQTPIVKDKGQYRQLWLSDWMMDMLTRYERLRDRILNHTGVIQRSPTILCLIAPCGTVSALSASTLRRFLKDHHIDSVAYQLRHSFAQALSERGVPTEDLNRLMGHCLDGEQLGAMMTLGDSSTSLITHLNHLTHDFRLTQEPLQW